MLNISKDLSIKFKMAALRKFRNAKGSLTKATEEAMKLWLEDNKEFVSKDNGADGKTQ